MDVLDRTGSLFLKESATATRQIALNEMKQAGESKLLTMATAPFQSPKRLLGDRINDFLFGKYSKNLADAMLSKRAATQLTKLLKLKPKSRELIAQTSTFLTMVSKGLFSDAGADQMPHVLRAPTVGPGRPRMTR